ncbi:MAG: LysR family transcriptional regulator [Actinophytocola sp.]|nr:LysR family transcriptional regulator [Actinophytocola sp.]
MTLSQLRTFLAVADTGSVHAAADQLFVTQSAVSASLTSLQRSLGFPLLRREGRGLRLTEAGAVYADYIRRVLGLLDEAGSAAAAEANPERGSLRIAATTTAGEQILPRLLTGFRQRHPHIEFRLDVGNRKRGRALLDGHEVDLLLSGRPTSAREVAVLGLRPHELIAVAAPDAAADADRHDPLDWMAGQTWLLREEGSGTRAATEDYLASVASDHSARTLTVGSNAAIRESAIAGLGVALVAREAVARELREGRLAEVALPGTPLPKDWYLTANPGKLPGTAGTFVAYLLMTGEFQSPHANAAARAEPREHTYLRAQTR